MECPACTAVLTPLAAGSVTVDRCGGCGGVWLDAGELRRLPEGEAALLSWGRAAADQRRAPAGGRRCPRCRDRRLITRPLHDGSTVAVDDCPGCCGLWLDQGELLPARAAVDAQAPTPARRRSSSGTGFGTDILGGLFDLVTGSF